MLTDQQELKLKAERDALHMTTAFLLYERQEETEIRNAFAMMVQERHAMQHDKEENITQFTDCANLICINALKMLQNARKTRIELNELSIQMLTPYNLIVQRDIQNKIMIAYLEDPKLVKEAEPTLLKI